MHMNRSFYSISLQRQFICSLLGLPTDIFYDNLKSRIADKIGDLVEGVVQLNLLEDIPMPKLNSPVDALSHYLHRQLKFSELIGY